MFLYDFSVFFSSFFSHSDMRSSIPRINAEKSRPRIACSLPPTCHALICTKQK